MSATVTSQSPDRHLGGRDPELATIADLRRHLVAAKADLRCANDDLSRRRRAIERERYQAGFVGKVTDKDKARSIEWACDDDPAYTQGFGVVRELERQVEKLEALIEIALAPIRKDQWLVRAKLADALTEYALRPCMGVQEHALIDTAFDMTDEGGVYAGDSRYIERERF